MTITSAIDVNVIIENNARENEGNQTLPVLGIVIDNGPDLE